MKTFSRTGNYVRLKGNWRRSRIHCNLKWMKRSRRKSFSKRNRINIKRSWLSSRINTSSSCLIVASSLQLILNEWLCLPSIVNKWSRHMKRVKSVSHSINLSLIRELRSDGPQWRRSPWSRKMISSKLQRKSGIG
jgi:hypothetical protein